MLPKLHAENRIKFSAICRAICIVRYIFMCMRRYTVCRVKEKIGRGWKVVFGLNRGDTRGWQRAIT